MIISISGPSCTGKTTLFQHLQDPIRDLCKSAKKKLVSIEEGVKDLWECKWSSLYKSLDDLVLSSDFLDWQYDVLNKYILEMHEYNPARDVVLTDRCELDVLVYSIMATKIDRDRLSQICEDCNKVRVLSSHQGRLLFLTCADPSRVVEFDGVRSVASYDRDLEIRLFETLPTVMGYDIEDLPDSTEDRVSKVVSRVKETLWLQ